MQGTKMAWKMWRFPHTNVYVVANKKWEAKVFFHSFMSEAMCYQQAHNWGYGNVENMGINDWYEYVVQGPNVWFQPDPESNRLERMARITWSEAKLAIAPLERELKSLPMEELLKRVLAAEHATGAISEGVPYYIRRHAVLHGDHDSHTTISHRLCYSQITPELVAYQVEIDMNDPR